MSYTTRTTEDPKEIEGLAVAEQDRRGRLTIIPRSESKLYNRKLRWEYGEVRVYFKGGIFPLRKAEIFTLDDGRFVVIFEI